MAPKALDFGVLRKKYEVHVKRDGLDTKFGGCGKKLYVLENFVGQ